MFLDQKLHLDNGYFCQVSTDFWDDLGANIEISMMHEQKQGKIRYVGIFQNVRKSMLVVEYFIANCNQICDPKMGGIDIIYKGPVWETYRWLLGVSQKESKYTSLVQMENTFWMLEEMNRI